MASAVIEGALSKPCGCLCLCETVAEEMHSLFFHHLLFLAISTFWASKWPFIYLSPPQLSAPGGFPSFILFTCLFFSSLASPLHLPRWGRTVITLHTAGNNTSLSFSHLPLCTLPSLLPVPSLWDSVLPMFPSGLTAVTAWHKQKQCILLYFSSLKRHNSVRTFVENSVEAFGFRLLTDTWRPAWSLFPDNSLVCPGRKRTGLIDNVDNSCIPFICTHIGMRGPRWPWVELSHHWGHLFQPGAFTWKV